MVDIHDEAKDTITQLQHPIRDLQTLLSLLTAPLDALGILPPQFHKYNTHPLPSNSITIRKHVSLIQRALLEHVLPTWDVVLQDNKPDALHLITQYFCPDPFVSSLSVSGELALKAYETILTSQIGSHAINLLEHLAHQYPVDSLWTVIFSQSQDSAVKNVLWEDCVRDVVSVPAKVANAMAERSSEIPLNLENGTYINGVCRRVEVLVQRFSRRPSQGGSVSYLMSKLVNIGAFPPSPPTMRSLPSFWYTNLPIIRPKVLGLSRSNSYCDAWQKLILSIPSSLTLQSVLTSLLASLEHVDSPTDPSTEKRVQVKTEAKLLTAVLGRLSEDENQLWEIATSLILNRDWEESYARIFVCWLAHPDSQHINNKALAAFLELVVDAWSTPVHIKHSLLSRHRYLTSLFLLSASYFSPSSNELEAVVSSPLFMQGIGSYISHLDTSIRRCGMLVAEIIAQMTDKKLVFGDWDGDDSGKPWCRQMRNLIKARDVDADIGIPEASSEEVDIDGSSSETPNTKGTSAVPGKATFITSETGYDSDDSLTGYASPDSSRSASPTPSELEDIEKDPTLSLGVKKVPRPVYLAQLGDLVRGTGMKLGSDQPQEVDKIEMALNHGEELIRKKRGYGTELEENAVNLVYGFLGLHDNFDLAEFDEKRQGIMNALIACAPRKAAPALIEEFYKNQYSVDQRHVALNALVIGARELASLPVPPSRIPEEKTKFPSKMLPQRLHQQYLAASQGKTTLLPLMVEDLSRKAIDRGKEATEDKVPEVVREKRLTIKKTPRISEVKGHFQQNDSQPKVTTFTDIAAEYFICPLINHFWLFLRDEQTREGRTSQRGGRQKYHSAGTGLILNPLVLSQLLRALSILVDASRNAPEWLAIIAPDSLELAVTIGTRPVSIAEEQTEEQSTEAAVLTSALELALIVLDGCIESDGGKSLGLDHTTLLFGTGEWAGAVFAKLDKGIRIEGGGGLNEVKLQRAAAGVLLKVDELTSRWKRSMVDTR
ncbi:hypothetical protein AGABI1DRAFT_69024 [Agaricus bisporus var. burnettii JB137-S8]|uniref:Telomere length regulation protein conserved domain-containing protein n=1 Tax=Agaricus bisporus var. burnettii (strain JB137-S8 / ATCC MYA-4627 / FGSC 10392) TaxID=597362 RepID=K5XHL8_AGABU|nr:uncharacterized protein AGABI1DRAFT_69024 [Agaricus bisporus var. burnettii JB137-S8]EKM82953.1 hypothetical protein AGABI1DRAFT_69024 [Agaricus bisporus var. burnettii JB137-S8]